MDRLKEGPLAPVWMAANYEKKLSKQQFLNTNIVTSSNLLNTPINTSSENITLRLSGQLLLGIVRIYSRKTKYLLDDVNDILYKLKNSFKMASGGVLLGSESDKSSINSHHNTISKALTGQRNMLSNVNNNILQDQITGHDLLYQEDLDLGTDDRAHELSESIFSRSQSRYQTEDHSNDVDQSIEFGRYDQFDDAGDHGADIDFDLNFDNNEDFNGFDESIEVGRNASNPINPDFSLLDINDGSKEVNLGVDAPLDTIDDDDENSPPDLNEPLTPPQTELPSQGPPKPRKKLVGITEEGTLKTNKRKLQVDSEEDVESGITIDELRSLQSLQLNGDWREESYTFKLSDKEKLQLIQELSEPVGLKKRKLQDLNSELSKICQRISKVGEEKV